MLKPLAKYATFVRLLPNPDTLTVIGTEEPVPKYALSAGDVMMTGAAVWNVMLYGANSVLPDTALTAELLTTIVTFELDGRPAPAGVKVIVSFGSTVEDQLNEPLTDRLVLNAACTVFVFIGSLNCSTIGEKAGTLAAQCTGELLMTTGSSGCHCERAMNIFAVTAGTVIEGVCELLERV